MYNAEATAELGAYVQYPAGVLFYGGRVRGLLREGADPNQIIAATGQTPLQALCIDNPQRRQSAFEAFQYLLDAPGIDVNICSSDGSRLIHAVCKLYKSAEFLYAILRKRPTLDIDINARDRFGRTALHYACERGRPIVSVQYLVDAGADCNVLDENGNAPLHYAINAYDVRLIRLLQILLHRGRADPNIHRHHPRMETPYERAIEGGLSYYAQILFLNAGADDSEQLSSLLARELMMMFEPAERTARIYKADVTDGLVTYVLEEDRREFSSDEIQSYIEDGANPNEITRGMPLVDFICRRFRGSEGLLALKYLLGLPNIMVDIADSNGKILIHRLASMRKSNFLYILLKNDRNIRPLSTQRTTTELPPSTLRA
jgi:ankyrin repeat protein